MIAVAIDEKQEAKSLNEEPSSPVREAVISTGWGEPLVLFLCSAAWPETLKKGGPNGKQMGKQWKQ